MKLRLQYMTIHVDRLLVVLAGVVACALAAAWLLPSPASVIVAFFAGVAGTGSTVGWWFDVEVREQ